MTEHELKILPTFYEAVLKGYKTFEIRKNDRGFKVGDSVILREFIYGEYTERVPIKADIDYILFHEEFPEGLQQGYVILGLARIKEYPSYDAKKEESR